MAVETESCSGVLERSEVVIEEKSCLNLTSCEAHEKVGEVSSDIACDCEEKSDGEAKSDASFVVVSEEEDPLLGEEVKVEESDDSCNVESLSSVEQEDCVGCEDPVLEVNSLLESEEVRVAESNDSCNGESDSSVDQDEVVTLEDHVLEVTPLLELTEARVAQSDDSCNLERDSSTEQDVYVDGEDSSVVNKGIAICEPEGIHVDDDENTEEREVEAIVDIESVQPEVDSMNSARQKNDGEFDTGDLGSEIGSCPVNNTQLEAETKIDEEVTEDVDSSYVYIDGADVASDEPKETKPVIEDTTNLRSVYSHAVVVGTVVCGVIQISTSSTENSPNSVDNAKLEDSTNDVSTEAEVINATIGTGGVESDTPAVDVELASDVGSVSTLSNRESIPTSGTDALDEKVDTMEKKKIFRRLVKVPRYINSDVEEQIGRVQQQIDEATRMKDAIRAEVLAKKDICNKLRDKFEAAKSEEKAAYDALRVKRQELDSVQSVFKRIKNAISFEEIGRTIYKTQQKIEHETNSLTEEKQLIRELKQLKLKHQQLSSDLDRQAEMQLESNQKEELENRLKLLKQDMDGARKEIQRMAGICDAARKIYIEENNKLRQLQAQFTSANGLRQEGHAHLYKLKKQLYDKKKYFRMYKEDAAIAEKYAFLGDREALHCHCSKQVEKLMDLWNTNYDFRNEYLRCNTIRTLRRLGTLDGRSLGPDEYPPIRQKVGDDKISVAAPAASTYTNYFPPVSTLEPAKLVLPSGPEMAKEKSGVKQNQRPHTVRSKESIPFVLENSSATVSDMVEVEEKTEEEIKQTQEEKELARKEELLRKETADAKLREQSLLEERTKAKEAEERKRRNAEKAVARAELKAQREAELKEKERAKKERRKARKKATQGISENEASVQSSENTLPEPVIEEPEIEEQQPKAVASKRPQKASALAKQAKVVPLPLRNKNKKRMQPWMWVLLLLALVVFAAVFLLPTFQRLLV